MTLEYFIKQNTWLPGLDHGWGNGYVVIPPNHPFYGIHYDKINELIYVHGGLTFSAFSNSIDNWPEYCDHYNGCWIIGFDTCHYEDTIINFPKDKVLTHTKTLAIDCEFIDKTYLFDINFMPILRRKN